MSSAHGPITVVQTQVADIKEKNYEEEERAGAGAVRRGLVWFGLFCFVSSDVA
jgi:hypothetical protein